ncbi:hypothetical protein R6Q57_009833 [Mikania cordata]
MKKVVVAQKDQELLKKETIVSIPTHKYQLVVVQQLNVQQGEIRLRKMARKRQKKQETERENMQLLHLNTPLAKESLSPEEVAMKRYLMTKFYGN